MLFYLVLQGSYFGIINMLHTQIYSVFSIHRDLQVSIDVFKLLQRSVKFNCVFLRYGARLYN